MERFVEAHEDRKTGLTYPALTGIRKQSVEDVEWLFGQEDIDFMKDKNYEEEAEYLQKLEIGGKLLMKEAKGRGMPEVYYRILRLHNQWPHAMVFRWM